MSEKKSKKLRKIARKEIQDHIKSSAADEIRKWYKKSGDLETAKANLENEKAVILRKNRNMKYALAASWVFMAGAILSLLVILG